MLESNAIPIVSMSGILDDVVNPNETERQSSRKELLSAFETTGIAYLHFNGKTRDIFDAALQPAFQESKAFFSRPLFEKRMAACPGLPPGVTRGYLGTAAESGADKMELKEAFSWSYDWSRSPETPDSSFEAENVWPKETEEMQAAFNDLFTFFTRVLYSLCDVLAEELNLPLREIAMPGETISLVRAFHYHASESRFPKATGSCAHTDWGFATLVAQEPESEPALQADLSGWVTVPPKDGTLIVNASDFLSVLTHGRVKSPLHRVVLTEKERFSFVYFHYPGYDTIMPETDVKGISLLTNQCMHGGERVNYRGRKFGDLISEKWGQVSRKAGKWE